nr:hypothetical protein CFP56_36423 [Quercus suber]
MLEDLGHIDGAGGERAPVGLVGVAAGEVGPGPARGDGEGVDVGVALGVVLLDVAEVGGGAEGGIGAGPVEIHEPVLQDGVGVAQHAEVALEVLHVDDVEADERGVGAHVELRQRRAEQVGPAVRVRELLERVERGEDDGHVGRVGRLVAREAGLVDLRVQVGLQPGADAVDVGGEGGGVEGEVGERGGEESVEGGLQVTKEFQGFVVDDGAHLRVPEHRHGVPALVLLVSFEVQLVQVLAAEQLVFGGAVVSGFASDVELPSGPTLVVPFGIRPDDGSLYARVLRELLHVEDEVGAVGERAEEADISWVRDSWSVQTEASFGPSCQDLAKDADMVWKDELFGLLPMVLLSSVKRCSISNFAQTADYDSERQWVDGRPKYLLCSDDECVDLAYMDVKNDAAPSRSTRGRWEAGIALSMDGSIAQEPQKEETKGERVGARESSIEGTDGWGQSSRRRTELRDECRGRSGRGKTEETTAVMAVASHRATRLTTKEADSKKHTT